VVCKCEQNLAVRSTYCDLDSTVGDTLQSVSNQVYWQCIYRLLEPLLHSILRAVEGFFCYNFPKLERLWMKPGIYISLGPQCVVALKIFWEIAPGVPPNGAKAHFIIFRYESNVPFRTLNSSLILAIFVATDVNRCASAYICENFWNFCVGVLQAQKPAPRGGNFASLLSSYSINSTISGDRRIRTCQLGILCAGFWTRFYCSFCLLLCTLVSNHWQSYRLCSVLTQLQLVDFFY